MEFEKMFLEVKTDLEAKHTTIVDLQMFLSFTFPELAAELETAESIEELLTVFSIHTSLINVYHLKAIAVYFELFTAIKRVQEYDDTLDEFCREVFVNQIYGHAFMYNSSKPILQSETIEFTLKCSDEEKSLYDVKEMLNTAFQVLVHHIMLQTVLTNGDEISLFCFSPLHLCGELLGLVQKNKEQLRKSGLLSVSIAGSIVIRREEVRIRHNNEQSIH